MGKKIMVNWEQLYKLSSNTEKDAEEFEKIRTNIEQIITSINSCWQGIDANQYIKSTTNYFQSLKQDTEYMYSLAKYFSRSASRYSGGVEDSLSRVKNLEKDYIMENIQSMPLIEGDDFYG